MILTPYAMFHRVVSGTIAEAIAAENPLSAAVGAWWRDLERMAQSGHFLAGFAGFVVCGRTP